MKKEVQHSTLYRAYRPQSWGEVRGQQQVVAPLQNALKHPEKMAHAYLFSGGRGTGKTSVARILARELGVSEKDLYEIDAASNRGIDEIRALRESVYAMPFDSPYKFYIIDEAHMLTTPAWNALLKTLEEPPSHAMFVLATTEREKVPDTIQSRCELYSFKQPTREILSEIIEDIAKKEGYSLERAGAELIALLAEGSFRDALSILQKVLSASSGKKVSATDIEKISGAPKGELVRQLLSGLATKDANAGLKAIRSAIADGVDARTLARLLIHRMRIVLLMRNAPDLAKELSEELTETDRTLAKELAGGTTVNSDMLRIVLEAYSQMAYAAVPHLPLELAVVDIAAGGMR
ncbi:MAG TPA: DNA polymerase III subunit gamma/tau [Candidatus Paceibacterota bacterium]|nr:DNA polymerase III subunit gamma/tau [Candidatus Paceibacterota bacterium]